MLQIHEKLRAARVKAGLTQDEIAEKIGIKRSTYQHWEKETPSIAKLKKAAKALGKPEDYFLGGKDENIGKMQEKVEEPEAPYGNREGRVLDTIERISRSNDKLIDQQASLIATNTKLAEKLLAIGSDVPVEESLEAKALKAILQKLAEVGVSPKKWKTLEEAGKELGTIYNDYVRSKKEAGKSKLEGSGSSKMRS